MLQTSNFLLVIKVRGIARPLVEDDDVGPLLEPIDPNPCLVAWGRVQQEMVTAGGQPLQFSWATVGSQFKNQNIHKKKFARFPKK